MPEIRTSLDEGRSQLPSLHVGRGRPVGDVEAMGSVEVRPTGNVEAMGSVEVVPSTGQRHRAIQRRVAQRTSTRHGQKTTKRKDVDAP